MSNTRSAKTQKILPQVILEIQKAIKEKGIELSGYTLTLDTVSHSNGHNNHSDHTDVEREFRGESIITPDLGVIREK